MEPRKTVNDCANKCKTICLTEENIKTIDTKIKIEKDFININAFEGIIIQESHPFELITNMNSNKRSTFKEKPFTCNVCRKEFSNTYKFKLHKKCHPGHNHLRCNTCKVSFNSKKLFTRHVSSHDTNKREKLFICGICNKSYYHKMHLKKHIMLHTEDQAISRAPTLETHTKLHNGEKKYKCDICGTPFSRADSLKTHVRIHTGDKPFKCDICKKPFSRSDALKTHQRTHTVENPYKCGICEHFSLEYKM